MLRPVSHLVISHWYKLFDDFQTSGLEFYAAVEAAVQRRQVPDASTERIEHAEAGLLSARRQYLRVRRGRHAFDICAAPFGTGYFFSWWLAEVPPRGAFLWFCVLVFGVLALPWLYLFLATLLVAIFGAGIGTVFSFLLVFVFLFGLPLGLWLLGEAIRDGRVGNEDLVLAIPLVGRVYEWFFKPDTYYNLDTALMFQSAVHTAVLEVIDELTATKGVRALSDAERKPLMREFAPR